MESSTLGELPYNRVLIANLIASREEWKHAERVLGQIRTSRSPLVQREFMLALRRAPVGAAWFQERWRELDSSDHWTRRALLAGAASLPGAARKAYVSAWRKRLDPLERAIADWPDITASSHRRAMWRKACGPMLTVIPAPRALIAAAKDGTQAMVFRRSSATQAKSEIGRAHV